MGQDAEGNTEVAEKDYDDGDDDEKNETIKVPPFWFVVKKFLASVDNFLSIQFFEDVL